MAIDCTPDNLADLAKCFDQTSQGQLQAAMVYLLCQIANNGGGGGVTTVFSSRDNSIPITLADLVLGDAIDITPFLIPMGWNASAEAAIWSAIQSGKQIQFTGFGVLNVDLDVPEGSLEVAIQPFCLDSASSYYFEINQDFPTSTTITIGRTNFAFDCLTSSDFATSGECDSYMVSVSSTTATGATPFFVANSYKTAPNTPKISLWVDFTGVGSLTSFYMLFTKMCIKVIG